MSWAAARIASASMPNSCRSSTGCAGPRHSGDRELADADALDLGERGEHGIADAALGPVVLDGDDRAGVGGRLADGLLVDGLDRVEVDHPGGNALSAELFGRLERLVERDAGPDQGHLILVGGAQDARAADLEPVVGPVDRGRGAAARPHVGDPGMVGHLAHERGRLVRVRGVQDRTRMDGAEHREVLERHLRGPVLADRDAGVRADEAQPRTADRRHPHEVVGAREERGERRCERPEAADLESDRGGDHLLLGDEHLEVAVGMRLGEQLGECRVRHLAVERDDVGAFSAERRERLAVGPPGGDLDRRRPSAATRRGLGRSVGAWRRRWAWPRSTRSERSPPSSSIAFSGSDRGLPCLPSRSSTSLAPFPFLVRATITVGRSSMCTASAKAPSISSTS